MHPTLEKIPSRLKQRLHSALNFVNHVDEAHRKLLVNVPVPGNGKSKVGAVKLALA